VVVGDRGCAGWTVAARKFGRRVLQLETVEFETSLHGTTGHRQLASAPASSNRVLSNRPLQRTIPPRAIGVGWMCRSRRARR
jgi:hypothetical protein